MQLHDVLWPNKYLMTVVGLWPLRHYATRKRRIFLYLRFIMAMLAMISLLVPHLTTVVANWGNVEILGDCGARVILYALVVLKMSYYALRHRSYRSMYQSVKVFWQISDDPVERANYEQYASMAKRMTITSFLSGLLVYFSFVAVAMMTWSRERALPLDIFYGFDTQRTPIYEIIFVWQNICMLYSLCTIIGGDCTMMALVLHLAGQFKLINFRLRSIGRIINEEMAILKGFDKEVREAIGKCVAQHQHVIRVTEKLDALISPLIFGQIMTSGLEICLSGYAVIDGDHSGVAELMKFLMFFLLLLVQLSVWCWPAEFLINESNTIAETIYHDIPWFKLTPAQRRDISFIVLRAQKSCRVSALYQVMSVRKLTDVFNSAAAYMTLLRSIKK